MYHKRLLLDEICAKRQVLVLNLLRIWFIPACMVALQNTKGKLYLINNNRYSYHGQLPNVTMRFPLSSGGCPE